MEYIIKFMKKLCLMPALAYTHCTSQCKLESPRTLQTNKLHNA